jgi:hypothetical protein
MTRFSPSRSNLLALCVAGALFAASTPGFADSSHAPAITEAHADGAMLRITGLELAGGTPKLTLGSAELSIVSATATHIDALLPVGVAPGSYLLTLTLAKSRNDRSDDNSKYEEFWVTIGAAGAAGKDGVAGPQGPAGPMGATGAIGPQGSQGLAGAKGDPGPQGPAGNAGPAGPSGPAGPGGKQGENGLDGKEGARGPEGPVGPAGQDGPIGKDGATGPAGPAGLGSTSGQGAVTVSSGPIGATGNNAAVLVSATVTIPPSPPDWDLLVSFTGQAKATPVTICAGQYQLQLDSELPETVVGVGPLSNDLNLIGFAISAGFTQAFNGLAAGTHTVTVLGRRGGCPFVTFLESRLTTVILRK